MARGSLLLCPPRVRYDVFLLFRQANKLVYSPCPVHQALSSALFLSLSRDCTPIVLRYP